MWYSSNEWQDKRWNGEILKFNKKAWNYLLNCKGSLGKGNVFTPVCHSVHKGEVVLYRGKVVLWRGEWCGEVVLWKGCCEGCGAVKGASRYKGGDAVKGGGTVKGLAAQGVLSITGSGIITPPLWTAPTLRSTSGRYTSYWNAFLFYTFYEMKMKP